MPERLKLVVLISTRAYGDEILQRSAFSNTTVNNPLNPLNVRDVNDIFGLNGARNRSPQSEMLIVSSGEGDDLDRD